MFYLYSPLWGISLIVQVYFAVHAYRHGKSSWVYIILFFPMVGALIYFFAEYLPGMRRGKGIVQVSEGLARKFAPGRELQRLKDETEFNNSLSNRIALAWGLMDVEQYDEAVEVLTGCLDGLHENDPKILSPLATAYMGAGKARESLDVLTLLRKEHPRSDAKGTVLLIARTLERMDDLEGACKEYEAILQQSVGEEALCRYALLLKKMDRHDDAAAKFEEVLSNVELSPRFYRKTQRQWIQIAKRELQEE